MNKGRPIAVFYEMGGQRYTCRQLSEMAGCSNQAMHRRLARGHSPAEAIAWGPADRNRKRPEAKGRPGRGIHELNGQQYTCSALALMAGCGMFAMRARLRSMSPADAVARGAADSHRKRKADDERKTPVMVKEPKPPKPAKVKQTKPPASVKLSAKSWSLGEKKADKRTLKPSEIPGEPIRTEKTVVTVAPTPRPRFYVDPKYVLPTFGRIGQYESTGSAIEAQYR